MSKRHCTSVEYDLKSISPAHLVITSEDASGSKSCGMLRSGWMPMISSISTPHPSAICLRSSNGEPGVRIMVLKSVVLWNIRRVISSSPSSSSSSTPSPSASSIGSSGSSGSSPSSWPCCPPRPRSGCVFFLCLNICPVEVGGRSELPAAACFTIALSCRREILGTTSSSCS